MSRRVLIENGSPNDDVLSYGMVDHTACQLTLQNKQFCFFHPKEQNAGVVHTNTQDVYNETPRFYRILTT
jgi:hypothetical protein